MNRKLALIITTMMIQSVAGSPINSASSSTVSSPDSAHFLAKRYLEKRENAANAYGQQKKKCRYTKYGEKKPAYPTPTEEVKPKETSKPITYTQPKDEPVPEYTPPKQEQKPAPKKEEPKPKLAPTKKEESKPTYGSTFENACLEGHNKARADVGLPPLKWDPSLVASGKSWSNKLANENANLYHSKGTGEGENLYRKWLSFGRISDEQMCRTAVKAWVDERSLYDREGRPAISNNNYHGWGHYTQIVWKSTTRVGCAVTSNRKGNQYVTCRYEEPGNVIGKKPY